MVLNTLVTHVGVSMQQIQPQPSLVTNPISVSQHLSSKPQPITPLIVRQLRIVCPLKNETI